MCKPCTAACWGTILTLLLLLFMVATLSTPWMYEYQQHDDCQVATLLSWELAYCAQNEKANASSCFVTTHTLHRNETIWEIGCHNGKQYNWREECKKLSQEHGIECKQIGIYNAALILCAVAISASLLSLGCFLKKCCFREGTSQLVQFRINCLK